MYRFALVAAAAAVVAVPALLTPTSSAEARTRVTVSPYYVPAVYCSYKSKDWVQQRHRLLPRAICADRRCRHEVEDLRGHDVLEGRFRRRFDLSRLLGLLLN